MLSWLLSWREVVLSPPHVQAGDGVLLSVFLILYLMVAPVP